MGGKHDSSRTRVAPVFSAVEARGSEPWLSRLLWLPEPSGALLPGELEAGSDLVCAFGEGTRKEKRLASPPALLVTEGKRTERGPTRDTQWMPGRHQMWRHIDAAWEVRGGRVVYGFFIVQDDPTGGIPEFWRQVAEETVSDAVLASSLPHRSNEERAALRRSFLGVTTWEKVVSTFGLPSSVLIPSVEPRTRK
jgi:hypothetical protein